MSRLTNLSTPVKFAPLAKFDKKTICLVEDDWHHATLTSDGLVPTFDNRYNDMDYTDGEIFHIIKTYGVRPPDYNGFWYDYDRNLSDDKLYKLAVLMTARK